LKSWSSRPPAPRHWPATALLLWLALAATPAAVAHASSSPFAERLGDTETTLIRTGQGTARYARFIPVYDAALYLEQGSGPAAFVDPGVAKRLDIVYRTSVKASDMVKAAERTLSRQHPRDTLARWREQIDTLHGAYRDVVAGDRYALLYQPGDGLQLEFNGKPVMRIAETEFAQLYLGIWLGDQPLSERLKRELTAARSDPSR
jgi:hypothetical protein